MDSISRVKESPKSRRKRPIIIGTGLLALDVVIADNITTEPILCAGGTCGNVLTVLSYLNWNAYPIARLRSDAASRRVTEDLKSWEVKLDFVTLDDEGSTPVIVQQIRRNKAGEPSHSFSRKCPKCGTWLPWYKAVRGADVTALAPRLPQADVFYFDRTSRGALNLAKHAFENGALVVFEPSSGSEPALLAEALEVAHIVKVASDRLSGNEGVLDAKSPVLLIETRGADGLRFRHRTASGAGRWKTVPAFKAEAVADTAGAGDWCTAGIVSQLGLLGVEAFKKADADAIVSALKLGQAMAAWACQFYGARGGMYESSKAELSKSVKCILEGELRAKRAPATPTSKSAKRKSEWCDGCLIGGRT